MPEPFAFDSISWDRFGFGNDSTERAFFFCARVAQHCHKREDLLSELRPPLDLQMLRQDYVAPTPTEWDNLLTSAVDGDAATLDEILRLGFSDLSCPRCILIKPGDGDSRENWGGF